MAQRVSVRAMIETPDLASATTAAAKLCAAVAGFGDPVAVEIDRYWKIEQYFEAVIVLQVGDPIDALRRLADVLAPDWDWGRDRNWAVWDPSSHGAFKVQSLGAPCRWAHIEVLPEIRADDTGSLRRGR
jgi:hypothetical protein